MHIVLSTIKPEAAESLALELIDKRLAACVNILPGITSVYRWDGAVQRDHESLLVIKTSAEMLAQLMRELPSLHPYEVPEIVALDVAAVHPAYAAWLDQECSRVKSD